MNVTQDIQVAETWRLQNFNDTYMSPEKLAHLVIHGFEKCNTTTCNSEYYCGKDSCRCIRSIFPHPQYYEQYTELRGLKTKIDGHIKAIEIGDVIDKAKTDN